MVLHKLFPITVGQYNLNRKFTETELNFLYSQCEMVKNHGNLTSKNTYILRDEKLNFLNEIILKYVDQYIQQIFNPDKKIESYITQSWINYTENNGWHHRHNHYNSFVSGVLYINTISDDRITFHRPGYPQIYLHSNDWTETNSYTWNVKVNSNDLVLFPSFLDHEVKPINTNIPRVSLAFNTFLRGEIGDECQLTQLKL